MSPRRIGVAENLGQSWRTAEEAARSCSTLGSLARTQAQAFFLRAPRGMRDRSRSPGRHRDDVASAVERRALPWTRIAPQLARVRASPARPPFSAPPMSRRGADAAFSPSLISATGNLQDVHFAQLPAVQLCVLSGVQARQLGGPASHRVKDVIISRPPGFRTTAIVDDNGHLLPGVPKRMTSFSGTASSGEWPLAARSHCEFLGLRDDGLQGHPDVVFAVVHRHAEEQPRLGMRNEHARSAPMFSPGPMIARSPAFSSLVLAHRRPCLAASHARRTSSTSDEPTSGARGPLQWSEASLASRSALLVVRLLLVASRVLFFCSLVCVS